jgi:ribonuclease HI
MDNGNTPEVLYPFPDEIVIKDREHAIRYARHIFDQGIIERCLVMWVDASVTKFPPVKNANRLSAAVVSYLDSLSKNWKEFVTFNTLQYGTSFASEAELIAIQEAFCIACGLTDDFDRLLIFSDCQSILEGIRTKSTFAFLPNKDVVNNVFMYANSLFNLGITVELRWTPAHSSIEGNERVDKLAKQCRRIAQGLLAQKLPDVMLKHVTIALSSPEEPHQTLLSWVTHQLQKDKDSIRKKRKNSVDIDGDAKAGKKRKLELQT